MCISKGDTFSFSNATRYHIRTKFLYFVRKISNSKGFLFSLFLTCTRFVNIRRLKLVNVYRSVYQNIFHH